MFLDLYIRYPFEKFIKGGFISPPKYQTQHVETFVRVNLLAGTVHIYGLGGDMVDTGVSYFKDTPKANERHRALYHVSIFDLVLFETVDAHQWNGWPKDDIRNGNGQTILKIPTMWEVAGVDSGEDQRVLVARTTAVRDEVFKLNTRLNKFFGFCQTTLEPFQAQILDMQKQGFASLGMMPVGTAGEMAHIFDDIGEAISDPDLDFKKWEDQL